VKRLLGSWPITTPVHTTEGIVIIALNISQKRRIRRWVLRFFFPTNGCWDFTLVKVWNPMLKPFLRSVENDSNSSWGKVWGLCFKEWPVFPQKKKEWPVFPKKKRNGRGSMQVSLHDSCAPATNHHSIFFFRSIFAFGAPPDLTQMSDPGRCPELLISQKVTAWTKSATWLLPSWLS